MDSYNEAVVTAAAAGAAAAPPVPPVGRHQRYPHKCRHGAQCRWWSIGACWFSHAASQATQVEPCSDPPWQELNAVVLEMRALKQEVAKYRHEVVTMAAACAELTEKATQIVQQRATKCGKTSLPAPAERQQQQQFGLEKHEDEVVAESRPVNETLISQKVAALLGEDPFDMVAGLALMRLPEDEEPLPSDAVDFFQDEEPLPSETGIGAFDVFRQPPAPGQRCQVRPPPTPGTVQDEVVVVGFRKALEKVTGMMANSPREAKLLTANVRDFGAQPADVELLAKIGLGRLLGSEHEG